MFSSRTTAHLDFVARQLSNLMPEESLDAALDRIAAASPAQYAAEIGYLRSLLTSSQDRGPTLGPNPYEVLRKLLPGAAGAEHSFIHGFVSYVQQSKTVFETYWAGVVGLAWYLGALAFVAVVIAMTFSLTVIPSFEQMFLAFGSELPAFTRSVFAFGGGGIPLLAIALTVTVGLVTWFIAAFHRRIQRLAPLPRWPSWAPVVAPLAEAYNLGLFLNFARLLRESGAEPETAVVMAAAHSNQPAGLDYQSLATGDGNFGELPVMTELGVSARLGHFDRELTYQCGEQVARLSLALIEARDRLSLLLKLGLYVFVAVLVVAMYLPIFKMGTVV